MGWRTREIKFAIISFPFEQESVYFDYKELIPIVRVSLVAKQRWGILSGLYMAYLPPLDGAHEKGMFVTKFVFINESISMVSLHATNTHETRANTRKLAHEIHAEMRPSMLLLLFECVTSLSCIGQVFLKCHHGSRVVIFGTFSFCNLFCEHKMMLHVHRACHINLTSRNIEEILITQNAIR